MKSCDVFKNHCCNVKHPVPSELIINKYIYQNIVLTLPSSSCFSGTIQLPATTIIKIYITLQLTGIAHTLVNRTAITVQLLDP